MHARRRMRKGLMPLAYHRVRILSHLLILYAKHISLTVACPPARTNGIRSAISPIRPPVLLLQTPSCAVRPWPGLPNGSSYSSPARYVPFLKKRRNCDKWLISPQRTMNRVTCLRTLRKDRTKSIPIKTTLLHPDRLHTRMRMLDSRSLHQQAAPASRLELPVCTEDDVSDLDFWRNRTLYTYCGGACRVLVAASACHESNISSA